MAIEKPPHHGRRFRPVVEIVGGGMDTRNTLTPLDEIHQALAQGGVFKCELGGIHKHDRVKRLEVPRFEAGHIIADDDVERAGLLTHEL